MAAPSGTVTFLFTDIEGSTGLWEAAPEAMRSALERHDAILRGAVDDFGGHVFATGGDGFAVAFARAADALSAAAAVQEALLAERWPTPSPLKVRMGVHTGEASERDGDYFGPVLNRAARLMAAGSGGQVLVSATTAGVVGVAELVDLGVHRLRDLAEAQHVFQVGDGTFPPLRTLDAFRTNLVPELSSFVGRDTELGSVAERLRAARVVSIVGVGGVGKTRLAVHVASELLPQYADGVWLCELAPVSEQGSIPDAVAAAVGYAPPQGVSVADGLPRFLERKELLLVLDNCEHLVDAAAAFVSSTTAAATRVSVLATSREALGVRGEQIFPLPSLGLPMSADAGSVLASEAGALFVARAGEAGSAPDLGGPTATAVYDLCVRLDGIPLAIELAAARTAMMTPAEIVARLDRQFQLLTGGRRTRLERHQTLRAAIDWSYDLLDHDERGLLNRLSVCVGGFELDAASLIAAGAGVDEFDAIEVLGSLVAKSLVERADRGGVTRYRLLEMIRQYATERLNSAGGAEAARDDHARHYLAQAVDLFAQMVTSASYDPLDRLTVETANIAAAARWLLAGDRLGELLGWFRELPFIDYFVLPTRFIDDLGVIAGNAVEGAGAAAMDGFPYACDWASARAFLDGDHARFGALHTLAEQHLAGRSRTLTLVGRSTVSRLNGDLDTAIRLAQQAVDQSRNDSQPALASWVLAFLAQLENNRDPRSATALAAGVEAVEIARRAGGVLGLLFPLSGLSAVARELEPSLALAATAECARLDRTQRQTWAASSQINAAMLHLSSGQIAAGLMGWLEALGHLAHNGDRSFVSAQIGLLAVALVPVAPEQAIELAAIAEADAIAPDATFTAQTLERLAETSAPAVSRARARAAAMSYDEAMATVTEIIENLIAQHRDTGPLPTQN